jgi:predicted nuclease of predicted toxin-antitoxin system
MKFLANENFPKPAIDFLRKHDTDIHSIAELHPGISDDEVMKIAIDEERTILTHDSDYGELIFKYGYKPQAGVIYFRIFDFEPEAPGVILLEIINNNLNFRKKLTVITETTIRQRPW